MFDGGGLYLEVSPAGGKLWRLKYRFEGKEKRLALGAYPAVGLREARARRDEAKKHLANGADPGAVRKAQKATQQERAANSFEVIAREWFAQWKTAKAESHSSKVIARLENDVFPWIGGRPVAEINAPDVLAVLRRIESRGVLNTIQKAKETISQVMRFAIATGRRTDSDPCPSLRGALPPVQHKHFASLTEPSEVGALLRAIDAFKGTYQVRAALALGPRVFVRPGELRAARWADIDLDKAEWKYVVSKTKTEHLVPLSWPSQSRTIYIGRTVELFSKYIFENTPKNTPAKVLLPSPCEGFMYKCGLKAKIIQSDITFRHPPISFIFSHIYLT
jgi:hypothetical protein